MEHSLLIADAATLQAAAALLHDSVVVKESWRFDPQHGDFTLELWKSERHPRRGRRCCWLFRRHKWLERQWLLRVSGVTHFDVLISNQEEYGQIQHYEVSDIVFDNNDRILRIMMHYVIDIALYVSRLNGVLEMTENVQDRVPAQKKATGAEKGTA